MYGDYGLEKRLIYVWRSWFGKEINLCMEILVWRRRDKPCMEIMVWRRRDEPVYEDHILNKKTRSRDEPM